jgi:hypothetical protein
MAWIDTSTKVNSDLDSFNYGTEADKLKRRRAAAQALQEQALRPAQGQFIKNGDYMGYVGGDNLLTAAMKVAGAYGGKQMNDGIDSAQGDLDSTSMKALAYQLGNRPWDDRARAAQGAQNALAEGDALDARNNPQTVSQAAPQPAQSFPVSAPQVQTTDLPVGTAVNPQAAARAVAPDPSSQFEQQVIGNKPAATAPVSLGSNARGIDRANRAAMAARILGTQGDVVGGGRGLVNPPTVTQPQPSEVNNRVAAAALTPPPATAQPAPPSTGMLPDFNAQQAAQAMPAAQPAPMPVAQRAPEAKGTPTQAELLNQIQKIAQTGPMGAQIAQSQLQDLFGGKGEYDVQPIKDKDTGDITAVLKFNKRTGAYQVDNFEGQGRQGSSKIIGTELGKDGIQYNRHKDGSLTPATLDGKPFVGADGQKMQQEQEKAKTAELSGIQTMKAQRAQLQDAIPLIQEVGTGRLQTPWNNMKAYVTDSTKLDKMNRVFNAQQLQDAVTWLKGQGSVTEGERALLAKGGFDPNASTASNMEYANTVLGMLNKHLDLAEQTYNQKYGGTSAPAASNSSVDALFPPRK